MLVVQILPTDPQSRRSFYDVRLTVEGGERTFAALVTNGVSVVLPPPFAGEAEGAMFRAWRAWTYDDFRAYA